MRCLPYVSPVACGMNPGKCRPRRLCRSAQIVKRLVQYASISHQVSTQLQLRYRVASRGKKCRDQCFARGGKGSLALAVIRSRATKTRVSKPPLQRGQHQLFTGQVTNPRIGSPAGDITGGFISGTRTIGHFIPMPPRLFTRLPASLIMEQTYTTITTKKPGSRGTFPL